MSRGGLYASFTTIGQKHVQATGSGVPVKATAMDTFGGRVNDDWFDADERDETEMADMTVDDNHSVEIGSDERRMHVRAYNHWVSLLDGRAYPSIEDLDPENIADFGPNSVLLDFTQGIDDPSIRYLGSALRSECGLAASNIRISQVPGRSLLSRLTDHYLQIIANRAPIGFEAEFVASRGHNTLYRGILMPFSSDGEAIDFIYGVINWKELADPVTQATLESEVAAAVASGARQPAAAAIWADGPSAPVPDVAGVADRSLAPAPAGDADEADAMTVEAIGMTGPLADQLMLARQSAAAVGAADTRSRAALYRALGRAYDFSHATLADPESYQALLSLAGIKEQARAPMTPVIKLIFGADYDKTRVTEFATVLDQAHHHGVETGGLATWLDTVDGGIKGVVAMARAARRAAAGPARPLEGIRQQLLGRAPMASVPVDTGLAPGELVVLVGRAGPDGTVDIIASVDDKGLTERAIRRAAA